MKAFLLFVPRCLIALIWALSYAGRRFCADMEAQCAVAWRKMNL